MNETEQIKALNRELWAVIERFRAEFNLSYASVIGTLEVVKCDLHAELRASNEDSDEPRED